MLEAIRDIGKRVFAETKNRLPLRCDEKPQSVRGAAGDWTYDVDRRAEEIILSGLESMGVSLTVISEEAGKLELNGGGDHTAIIDPVDGSKNALTGIPYYCTSIAVAEGSTLEKMIVGYVINLVNGDEYWAESGKGAFLNGNRMTTQQDDVLYLVSYEIQNPVVDLKRILPFLSGFRRTRSMGAIALSMSILAQGAASVLVSPALSRSFDIAAGYLLVKEAGGIVTDINGKSIDGVELGLKRTSTVLASGNGMLHEKALSRLRET